MYYAQFTIEPLRFIAFADAKGVFSLFINETPKIPKDYVEVAPGDERLFGVEKQLTEYFRGKRKVFKLKHHIEGTGFQMQVWDALKNIPYGTTISYKTLALQIGNEKAVRAVGGANKLNPLPIIVPCHRVIQADGSLGGYACGVKVKRLLLDLERGK